LVRVAPLLDRVGDFTDLIGLYADDALFAALREAQGTGRPLESVDFIYRTRAAYRSAFAKAEARTKAVRRRRGKTAKVGNTSYW
jgi:hypothetical protein